MPSKRHIQTDRDQPANDQLGDPQIGAGWACLSEAGGRPEYIGLFDRKGRDFSAQKVRPLFQIENKIWSEWTVDEQERYLLFTQKYRDSFKKYLHEDL